MSPLLDERQNSALDYCITRPPIGGNQRRVSFTVSAGGYVDGTDGVDVQSEDTRYRCKVYNSTSQVITDSNLTELTYDTEEYDTGALHSTSSHPGRITIPTGGDTGVWRFTLQVSFAGNAAGVRDVRIMDKNSTTIAQALLPNSGNVFNTVIQISVDVEAPAVGDYFFSGVYQNSGGNLNVNGGQYITHFSAIHLW